MEITRELLARVAGGDEFAMLSLGAQALYFQLLAASDGDGFVTTPKRIARSIGAPEEALAELKAGGYITISNGGCRVLMGDGEEKRERVRAQTRERVRRYRERKRAEKACNASVTPTPASSLLPPFSPSLPSPTPPSNTPPITPLKISSTPIISSSSLRYGERVQAMAKHFWDRSLRKYELQEILWLADRHVRRRGRDAELGEDDMELLEIAFTASADAGACSLAYLSGVYANWKRNGIVTSDEYWENEVRRDGILNSLGNSS